MLPLHTRATVTGPTGSSIFKVLSLREGLSGTFPIERVLFDLRGDRDGIDLNALARSGAGGVVLAERPHNADLFAVSAIQRNDVISPGDVIRILPKGELRVLYRRGANANVLFVTERCNSLCLMCSQPPRNENDDWRVREILELIPLIDPDLGRLGITGGEPTLLGAQLAQILATAQEHLPGTTIQVLTNGRLFSNPDTVATVADARGRVRWCIPLYADTPAQHDFVVQAQGAFDETINGIYNLAEKQQAIEIRVVLHALTIPRLLNVAEFVWRTMPFVNHIALMGLEPIGFAKLNRELLWIDPLDYAERVFEAAAYLDDRNMAVSIYNVPLCVLPRAAWRFAKQSISDWKNVFVEQCTSCSVRGQCCGFFSSADNHWRSRGVAPVGAMGAS